MIWNALRLKECHSWAPCCFERARRGSHTVNNYL